MAILNTQKMHTIHLKRLARGLESCATDGVTLTEDEMEDVLHSVANSFDANCNLMG